MQGDVDNIIKLIVDALTQHIYFDDRQVERIVVQKFEPGNVFTFAEPSEVLAKALETARPLVQRSARGSNMSDASEKEVLRGIIPALEAEGYEVFLDPRSPLAPDFLEGIRADAIAIRSDKKLLIELVHETGQESGKLERLRRLLKEQPGWELRVILVSPATAPKSLPVQSAEAITKSIHEAQRLTDIGFLGPGLLVGWASLEAAARRLITAQFSKPNTGPSCRRSCRSWIRNALGGGPPSGAC
jgi:REase_AHJR-like protein/endodeoxyribonuclease RusA